MRPPPPPPAVNVPNATDLAAAGDALRGVGATLPNLAANAAPANTNIVNLPTTTIADITRGAQNAAQTASASGTGMGSPLPASMQPIRDLRDFGGDALKSSRAFQEEMNAVSRRFMTEAMAKAEAQVATYSEASAQPIRDFIRAEGTNLHIAATEAEAAVAEGVTIARTEGEQVVEAVENNPAAIPLAVGASQAARTGLGMALPTVAGGVTLAGLASAAIPGAAIGIPLGAVIHVSGAGRVIGTEAAGERLGDAAHQWLGDAPRWMQNMF